MQLRRHIPVTLALLMVLAFLTSCSTKKNTGLGRFWHNLNTKYNGYFNGNEAIKLGMQDLSKTRKDDYTKIIPTFDYGERANWSSMNANSDKAIKKAVIMIKKHSMFINGKQYNRWIDDCYMLMGKANFFKLEHSLGVNQLKHVADNSEKQYTKDEAKIWMVRTYNEMGEFAESGTVIRGIDRGGVHAKLLPDYFAVVADYHIRQKEWEKALENIDEAIKYSKNKKRNARLEFIRGQIYEVMGDTKKAFASYQKVLKYKPEYVMEFQSRINMAKTAENSDNDMLRKTLKKMLKDGKNIEYLDQVYYATALIDLKEDKRTDAITNLNKSLRNSIDNQNQQALSHLKLAEIYLADRKYELAQGYYDSTSVLLSKEHPKYDEVMRLKENLTLLVENIRIVETQDSLQKLSKMDSTELADYFTKYVEALKEADEEAKNNPNTNPVNFGTQSTGNGKWYFTSPQALALGATEFRKVWGQRKLEDDWRRQNKAASFLTEAPEDTAVSDDANPRYDINTYTSQVPKGDSDLVASNEKIYKALYNIGTIYKDKILDYPKAIEAYEELETRANKNNPDYFPITYFQLYTLYKSLKKEEPTNRYKDILLTQYPNSDYAAIILDPEGFAKKNENNDAASPAYTLAYNMYASGDYMGCLNACNAAITDYGKSALLHRFALLKALCTDKISGRDAFKLELKNVVDIYKGTESALTAQRLINAIDGKTDEQVNPEVNVKAEFTFSASAEHFVIIYIPDATKRVDASVGKIIEFNDMEFEGKDYSVSNSILPKTGQVILIRKFTNSAEAMLYVNKYNDTNMVLKLNLNSPSKIMAISSGNFATLMKTPSMAEYQNFYVDSYK
jgi:lipopolysaccharide biosynthesis regulator YciM